MGTPSPGDFGTILSQSQNAWLSVQRTLGTLPWFGQRLSRAGSVFDTSGALTDKAVADQLQKFLRGFAEFAAGKARA